LKIENNVTARAISPAHETRVPTGKAVPLMTGMFNTGDPLTINKRQVIRTSEEINGRAFEFI